MDNKQFMKTLVLLSILFGGAFLAIKHSGGSFHRSRGGTVAAEEEPSPEDRTTVAETATDPASAKEEAGSTKVNSKDGQTYVYIPPGTFDMGCSPGDTECGDSEKPLHSVSITKGFWLGRTPVTQAAYKRVVGSDPSYFKGDTLPVEQVSWSEANQYCLAIGGRLPEDAEWEFAARAGSSRDRYGDLDDIAWHKSNSGEATHPVGLKQPNSFGLYDMLGNVWQWTANWYGTFTQDGDDVRGPMDGDKKTVRGGSWYDAPRSVRVSRRSFSPPAVRGFVLGFRCVGV